MRNNCLVIYYKIYINLNNREEIILSNLIKSSLIIYIIFEAINSIFLKNNQNEKIFKHRK